MSRESAAASGKLSTDRSLKADVVVVGAGIAGLSVAYELAPLVSLVVVERGDFIATEATARSAATLTETYGCDEIRRLTVASRAFFERPPAQFTDAVFGRTRGELTICPPSRLQHLGELAKDWQRYCPDLAWLDGAAANARCAAVDEQHTAAALFEPRTLDIDVAALVQGYAGLIKRFDGRILTEHPLNAATYEGGYWHVVAGDTQIRAQIIVNAAGAWADEVASSCGEAPVGIKSYRRALFTFGAGEFESACEAWPMVVEVDEKYYFKPDARVMLACGCEETEVSPSNCYPDDYDIAVAVDAIETTTRLKINKVHSSLAGLRCFAADRKPVIGMRRGGKPFFWLAGQGGAGIMTAPAIARLAASLLTGQSSPDLVDHEALSPDRFATSR